MEFAVDTASGSFLFSDELFQFINGDPEYFNILTLFLMIFRR